MKKLVLLLILISSGFSFGQCDYKLALTQYPNSSNHITIDINGVSTNYSSQTTAATEYHTFSVNPGDVISVSLSPNFSLVNSNEKYIIYDSEGIIVNANRLNPDFFNTNSTVAECPSCVTVDNITSTNLTVNSAEIGWTTLGTENEWEIKAVGLFEDPDIVPGVVYSTSTNPFVISGLPTDEMYDIYVRSKCGNNDFGKWRGKSTILLGNLPAIVFNDSDLEDRFLANSNIVNDDYIRGFRPADLNNDGIIQLKEALLVTEFNTIANQSISDFTGIEQFINIKRLSIRSFSSVIGGSIDLSNYQSIEFINLENLSNISALHLGNISNLEWLSIEDGSISTLDLSTASSLKYLLITYNTGLTTLDLSNSNVLESVFFQNTNGLATVSFPSTSATLESIKTQDAPLNSLDVSGFPNLKTLNIGTQTLNPTLSGSLDLSGKSLLEELILTNTQLNSVVLPVTLTLRTVVIYNSININSLDVTGNPNIKFLSVVDSSITQIDLSNNSLLEELRIDSSFTTLDASALARLKKFKCIDCRIENLDLSSSSLTDLDLGSNSTLPPDSTKRLYLKNGIDDSNTLSLSLSSILPLEYICVDNSEIQFFTNYLNDPNIIVNSYCPLQNGGYSNDIIGDVCIDIDDNGCDIMDPKFANFKFRVHNGSSNGNFYTNQQGNYRLPVPDGPHIITPQSENPSFWNFFPQSVTVSFPSQSSPVTQDFCVTANGTVEDLEVIVVPLEQARPGFDTDYKVVVKNKGNQTASGAVTLDFEEDFMTLLSTNPNAGNSPSNQLSWSFTGLQPFQMEEYAFRMTLNAPTATVNPLNGGDVITFIGTVTGTGTDANPGDNIMVFDQTLVNSYDPNDKTCLEGEVIEPAHVGEYVHYMIRFENTGTASAVNIIVKDVIDLNKFDINTLIPLDGSHDYYTRIRDWNVVEFIHEDINLDFNDATNDGYVLFKIKTLNWLVEGDTFDNTAEIFFDFNFPIVTNTETVTVMSTASIGEATDTSITVYPNPAKDFINLSALNRLKSATIMDINGRMLSQTNFTGSSTEQQISTENLNAGIYFVTIKSEVGQKVEKLIVE